MPRYKLTIEYDGTDFSGWQRQDSEKTVQGCLEDAVFAFCGERVTSHCAGRTDAGVHAFGQVAHIDIVKEADAFRVMEALNFHLLDVPVAVVKSEQVSEEFHARFSAKGRRYYYRIINRRPPLTIDKNRAWHVTYELDTARMQEAANHLVGTYDFTSFRASECQGKSPIKTLDELRIERVSTQEIHIHAASRSFLHHQVRNLAGSLMYVGKGKWTVEDLIAARDAKDRTRGGPTAPACGLYFAGVTY